MKKNTGLAVLRARPQILHENTLESGFGETCRLRLQGRRISQARNYHEVGKKQNQCSTRYFSG
jgi:hypothetical protein